MKLLVLLLSLTFTGAALSSNMPFLVLDSNKGNSEVGVIDVDQRTYNTFLRKTLRKVLKKKKKQLVQSNDYELNYFVLGLGSDLRFGFKNINVSPSAALEYHLKVLRDE